ncbi:MAG: hypothetical protein ACWA41_05775 [Putridiphycobacter sp.]
MYTLFKKIYSDEFDIVNNKLLYSYHEQLYFDGEVIYNGNPTSFKTFKSKVFIIDNFEKLIVLNLKNKNKKEFNFIKGISLIINENDIIYGYYSDDYATQYRSRINLETNEKKWTIESYFSNGKIDFNHLYTTSINNSICKINLDQPEQPLWQFELSKLNITTNCDIEKSNYKIIKIIGIWQEELFVACNNGLMLSLDKTTGKEKYRWQYIKEYEFDSEIKNKLPKSESFVFDGDTLIGALNTFYFKIDLKSSEIIAVNISQELLKFNIFHIKTVNDNPVTDKHIYLTAMMRQKDNDTKFSYDCLIALNKTTLNIDWQYKFENVGLGTHIPKISKNKLYQLDLDGNLHIFERE